MDGGHDPGGASHAALLELRSVLARHPAVRTAWGEPPDTFTRVRATVDPAVLGSDATSGSLELRWYAGERPEDRAEFAFHYSDSTGFDCGWHVEPNPHVDGWAHYQERASPDTGYEYRAITFASEHPVRVLWDVLDRLAVRLERFEE